MRANQRVCYAALFEASSEALKTLAADPKYVGTQTPGFFGVLPGTDAQRWSWGRTLEYHPHVHYVVPGGGLSGDGGKWLAARADFFVPVKTLSILFRAKFRDALKRADLDSQVPASVWKQPWVVNSRAAGDGRASLRYLAPYVFRVAIGDRRIISVDDEQVTFSYRKSGTNRWRKMTLDKNVFRCFHPECSAQGNVLDLWAAVHRLPLYEAAAHLAQTFSLELGANREDEPVAPASITHDNTRVPPRPRTPRRAGVITPDAH